MELISRTESLLRNLKPIILLLLIQTTLSASEVKTEPHRSNDDFDDELYSVIDSVKDGSLWSLTRHARSVDSNNYPRVNNQTFSDNSLWNDLWYECNKRTTFACIKSGVFKYLDKSLEMNNDVEVTDQLSFVRNSNKYNGYCENSDEEKDRCQRYNQEKLKLLSQNEEKNEIQDSDNSVYRDEPSQEDSNYSQNEDITEGAAEGRSIDSFSDVSDILYDKGTRFLMTHDMEFQLPQLFFGGGSVKIEPKSFIEEDDGEEEGTIVKIVIKPPPRPAEEKGRLLFHHLKKLFKKKLMHSFMALMLIIKMIKVKIMFLLPMIVGQSTAKRLLLKVLLFLIPGLAHLFKLCHYYHLEHAKYHHHHHKVKHHHHHVQVPVPVPVPVHHSHHEPYVHHHVEPNIHHIHEEPSYGGGSNDFPPYPATSHVSQTHGSPDDEYEYPPVGVNHNSGGSYNRGEYGSNILNQFNDNEAAMASWGLGSSNVHEAGVLDAKDQPAYAGYDDKRFKKSPYNVNGYSPTNYYQNPVAGYNPKQQQQPQQGSKLQLLTPRPPVGATTIPVSYDPFYSPILQKIDNIFVQLGFNEEACRERLVCSMYKAPHRFSPHSNLISAELSRDSRDLQKPVINNSAVVRFYKYVQAARDGQDQKDCLRLYPSCTVNTEG